MKKSQDPNWQAAILEHYKNPKAQGKPAIIWLAAEEHNRTCGDHIELFLTAAETEGLGSFRFTGSGCSLCIASASLMCGMLQNVDKSHSLSRLAVFKAIWVEGMPQALGSEWQIFEGLRDFPVRSRCVKLPWQALEKILEGWNSPVKGSLN